MSFLKSEDSNRLYVLISGFMNLNKRPPTTKELRNMWKDAFPNLNRLTDGKLHDVLGNDTRFIKLAYDLELPYSLHKVCHKCKHPIKHNFSNVEVEWCDCE